MRDGRRACSVLLLVLTLLSGGAAAGAEPDDGPSIQAQPASVSAEQISRMWDNAVFFERLVFDGAAQDLEVLRVLLAEAARLFEFVAQAWEVRADAYWRAARAKFLSVEALSFDDTERRVAGFEEALVLADYALELDENCAECMLWKFVAMGRLRTTQSVFQGVRQVPEMAKLLERGIELNPTHRDNDENSTLGNLHYCSAVFYRMVPEWFWLGWVLGVKGDKERALEHSRKALELHPKRLDYQVELGTQLMCLGTTREDEARLAEGRDVMRQALLREPANEDERRELYFAAMLLDDPKLACGYSGDKIIEIDEKSAKEARRSKEGMQGHEGEGNKATKEKKGG